MSDSFDLCAERMINAMRLAYRNSARQYLTGALVEPHADGGAIIVSADGIGMLVQHDRAAVAPRRAILRVTPMQFEREAWDDDDEQDIGWAWHKCRLTCPADGSTHAAPVRYLNQPPHTHVVVEDVARADLFPDWRKIWTATPKEYTEEERKLHRLDNSDAVQLAFLDRLCGLCGWTRHARLTPRGFGQPLVVTFPGDPDAIGLLMPCKTESGLLTNAADLLRRVGLADVADIPL